MERRGLVARVICGDLARVSDLDPVDRLRALGTCRVELHPDVSTILCAGSACQGCRRAHLRPTGLACARVCWSAGWPHWRLALQSLGFSPESLDTVAAMIERVRKLEGLTDQSETETWRYVEGSAAEVDIKAFRRCCELVLDQVDIPDPFDVDTFAATMAERDGPTHSRKVD